MGAITFKILIFLYNIVLFIFLNLYLLFIVCTFNRGKFFKCIKTNFGLFLKKKITNASIKYIWIHTSSVGESMLMFPLVDDIKKSYPDYKILVTSCTSSSKELWEKTFTNEIDHYYFPWDITFFVKRFLNCFNIKLSIFVEAEFWPNFLFELKRRKIPVMLFNARMSSRSYKRWLKFKFIITKILKVFSFIGAESQKSYNYISSFVNKDNVKMWGSLKYLDYKTNQALPNWFTDLKESLANRVVLLGLSTHDPEEKMLGEVYLEVKNSIPNLLFIISPRHVERSAKIERILNNLYLTTSTFSSTKKLSASTQIYIIDAFGYTDIICNLINIAYIGKSMFKEAQGGHNILQPMKKGIPVIFGKYMENFKDISLLSLNKQAALEVESPKELIVTLKSLLSNNNKLQSMGESAKIIANQDNIIKERYLKTIRDYLT